MVGMMRRCHCHTERGSFAIELAFVLTFISLLYLFVMDISQQLLTRGQLDRLSYSLVSVLKERSRFFLADDGTVRLAVNTVDLDRLWSISEAALGDNVGLMIESASASGDSQRLSRGITCGQVSPLHLSEVFTQLKSEEGEPLPLYRVTLCKQINAWFNATASATHRLQSVSLMVGR